MLNLFFFRHEDPVRRLLCLTETCLLERDPATYSLVSLRPLSQVCAFVRHTGILTTVWKFHDFPVTQILREINFGESRSWKIAVFAISEALDFVDLANFSLQKVQNFIKIKIQNLQMADIALIESPKFISRKI